MAWLKFNGFSAPTNPPAPRGVEPKKASSKPPAMKAAPEVEFKLIARIKPLDLFGRTPGFEGIWYSMVQASCFQGLWNCYGQEGVVGGLSCRSTYLFLVVLFVGGDVNHPKKKTLFLVQSRPGSYILSCRAKMGEPHFCFGSVAVVRCKMRQRATTK